MHIEFANTLDDIRAFTVYHYQHSPTVRRQKLIGQIVYTIVCVGAYSLVVLLLTGNRLATSPTTAAIYAGVGLIMAVVVFFRFRSRFEGTLTRNAEKLYKEGKNVGLFESRTITLDADGVRHESPASNSFTRWSSIEKVAVTADYLFIYYSALTALVIPRRAFADDAHWQDYVRLAQDYAQTVSTSTANA
jgi:hypothetical protein